ncbi:protein mono-ADP-ribosyltransferase PARP14-like [Haliotis cracherodii]|uniref:protein mono-ADP-ribosyltransferase PARP14-like n=1 Tax=Haliotis cracherodii TaxID=6455 RepID=UPI0039EB32AF
MERPRDGAARLPRSPSLSPSSNAAENTACVPSPSSIERRMSSASNDAENTEQRITFRRQHSCTMRKSVKSTFANSDRVLKYLSDIQKQGFTVESVPTESTAMETGQVNIVEGTIENMEADVLVNSAAYNLDLNHGAVAKAMSRAAGPDLQSHCRQDYPNGIHGGEVADTPPARLKCKRVFHCCILPWDKRASDTQKTMLKSVVTCCLNKMVQKGFTSIVFPVFGTGSLAYPPEVSAKLMLNTIYNHPKRSTLNIIIVVHPQDKENLKVLNHQHSAYEFEVSFAKVTIKQGCGSQEKVDAVVNNVDYDMQLDGYLSKELVDKCGGRFKQNSQAQKQVLQEKGAVAIERGFRLSMPWKMVIHVCGAFFKYKWQNAVVECIRIARKKRARSIVFPCLKVGQGNSTLDISQVANYIYEGIKLYTVADIVKENKITDIRFTILDQKVFSKMRDIISERHLKESNGPRGEPPPETTLIITGDVKATSEISQHLDDLLKETKERTMEDMRLSNLDDEELTKLIQKGRRCSVELDIDQSKNMVTILGFEENINEAWSETAAILEEAGSKKNQVQPNSVRWMYSGMGKRSSCDAMSNKMIETAYQQGQQYCFVNDDKDRRWRVSLVPGSFSWSLIQEPKNEYILTRSEITSNQQLPSSWTLMGIESFMEVEIMRGSKEFAEVERQFMETFAGSCDIVKIVRIQNKWLYQQYIAERQKFDNLYEPEYTNELMLWHGTKKENTQMISKFGFDRNYRGANATKYGWGTYFAKESKYSAHDLYSPVDGNGCKNIFQVCVLAGYSTKGKEDMKVLPERRSQIKYDSAVDTIGNPSVYVIFRDSQTYPKYLISFKNDQ